MKASRRLLAKHSTPGSSLGSRPIPLALLPPIPLYRRLFRAHRKFLPRDMRLLGDEYIKHEFRQHQRVENPIHIIGFLAEWQMYAQKIEGDAWREGKLDKGKIEKMSDQQLGQLYELMQSIQRRSKDESEEDS